MPINILHLHSTFAPSDEAARAVRLMNAFGDRAKHVIVSAVPDELGAREMIAKGIRYEIAQNPPPLAGKPSVRRYEAIARFMARFDLVLTYNWGAIDGVMARRVFAKGAPPVVHHEDGLDAAEARPNPIRNAYRRMALGAAHALAVPSHVLEKTALETWKQPREKVRYIAHGVNVAAYAGKKNPKAIPGFTRKEGETVIGAVIGLTERKDLPLLVRAAAGCVSRVRLVIVGEGPARQAIQDQAEAMMFEDELLMPGALPNPQEYMGLFDIFALTSKGEQAPFGVIEAMAAGLPVVATPGGDIAEMVAPENGAYLSPTRAEVHIRDRLDILAKHPEGRKAIGRANQARARALFDEAEMIAAYAKLYDEALGRPGALGTCE